MTDRLDAIAAGLRDGRYDCRVPGDTDDVRWLVEEVRRLRGELSAAEYHRDGARATIEQLERDLAALRERHAEDVEHAFVAGVTFTATCTDQMSAGLRKWPEYKAKWARREP
jgi:hypothetical protein